MFPHNYLFDGELSQEQQRLAEDWLKKGRALQWIANQFGCEYRIVRSFQKYLNRSAAEDLPVGRTKDKEFSMLMGSKVFQDLNVKPGFRAKIPPYVRVESFYSLMGSSSNFGAAHLGDDLEGLYDDRLDVSTLKDEAIDEVIDEVENEEDVQRGAN